MTAANTKMAKSHFTDIELNVVAAEFLWAHTIANIYNVLSNVFSKFHQKGHDFVPYRHKTILNQIMS